MVSSAASTLLKNGGNSHERSGVDGRSQLVAFPVSPLKTIRLNAPLLRLPPFPGARIHSLVQRPAGSIASSAAGIDEVAAALRQLQVGGSFWARQPDLPGGHLLVRSARALKAIPPALRRHPTVLWDQRADQLTEPRATAVVTGECDPWHMLRDALALVVENDDELQLIAGLLGVPSYRLDDQGKAVLVEADSTRFIREALCESLFENPFTGEPMDSLAAVELCGFWRRLIDSNRGIGGAVGFAFWKQSHVAPLLWDGSSPVRFLRGHDCASDSRVAVWRAKASPATLVELERRKVQLVEVEDGFLRSRGLGADCVPPLSITVDRLGAHFDPSRSNELEAILEKGDFDERTVDRARQLRRLIVDAGIAKYESGTAVLDRRAAGRRHILVPGQVEDDRAVVCGGCGLTSNLELLERVRAEAPDAYILYKPHPDVVAGHRRGAINDRDCLEFADEIVGELPIAALIDLVDEVHVNTSLAGFEALLRGKSVTTYGVPFYAGWGLTRDLGPVPARRTAKRTIDELVAAALLIYPRYVDPVTGLPCPAEVVVARLSANDESRAGFIVGVRRLQGKFMRHLRSLVQ